MRTDTRRKKAPAKRLRLRFLSSRAAAAAAATQRRSSSASKDVVNSSSKKRKRSAVAGAADEALQPAGGQPTDELRAAKRRQRAAKAALARSHPLQLDLNMLEEAMTAALAAAHGCLGACCLALRTDDVLLCGGGGEPSSLRVTWVAALEALEAMGHLTRAGVWYVAAHAELRSVKPAVLAAAAATAAKATGAPSSVNAHAFLEEGRPEALRMERRLARRAAKNLLKLKKVAKKAMKARVRAPAHSTRASRRAARAAMKAEKHGARKKHVKRAPQAPVAAAPAFNPAAARAKAAATGEHVFIRWEKKKAVPPQPAVGGAPSGDAQFEFIVHDTAGGAHVAARGLMRKSHWRYDSEPAFLSAFGLCSDRGSVIYNGSNQRDVGAWLDALLGMSAAQSPSSAAPKPGAAVAEATTPRGMEQ